MLRALVAFALLLAGLTVGTVANADVSHELAHSSTTLTAGLHHHHRPDGSVLDPDGESPTHSENHADADVVGHSHGATSGIDIADRVPERLDILPTTGSTALQAGSIAALATLGWSPDKPPPKSA
jgi:hypothetical protein